MISKTKTDHHLRRPVYMQVVLILRSISVMLGCFFSLSAVNNIQCALPGFQGLTHKSAITYLGIQKHDAHELIELANQIQKITPTVERTLKKASSVLMQEFRTRNHSWSYHSSRLIMVILKKIHHVITSCLLTHHQDLTNNQKNLLYKLHTLTINMHQDVKKHYYSFSTIVRRYSIPTACLVAGICAVGIGIHMHSKKQEREQKDAKECLRKEAEEMRKRKEQERKELKLMLAKNEEERRKAESKIKILKKMNEELDKKMNEQQSKIETILSQQKQLTKVLKDIQEKQDKKDLEASKEKWNKLEADMKTLEEEWQEIKRDQQEIKKGVDNFFIITAQAIRNNIPDDYELHMQN